MQLQTRKNKNTHSKTKDATFSFFIRSVEKRDATLNFNFKTHFLHSSKTQNTIIYFNTRKNVRQKRQKSKKRAKEGRGEGPQRVEGTQEEILHDHQGKPANRRDLVQNHTRNGVFIPEPIFYAG